MNLQKVDNFPHCIKGFTFFSKNLNGRKSNFPRSPKNKSRIANHAHNHAMLVMEADSDANKYVCLITFIFIQPAPGQWWF